MEFEWDEAKSKANEKKHGVTFDEAKSVFYDDSSLLFDIRTTRATRAGSCSSPRVRRAASSSSFTATGRVTSSSASFRPARRRAASETPT